MPGLVRRAREEGDIFESSVNLEESHYQLGFDEGFRDGVESVKVDGREVGLKNGFQVGEEIGFYTGCVDVWKAAVAVESSAFSSRAQRNIKQLEEKLLAYPLSDPEDERIQDLLEDIRVKFQAILSMLGIHLDYPGHPKSEDSVDESAF
jgi:hypothetical protein